MKCHEMLISWSILQGKKIEDCVDEIMEQLCAIMDENKR